MNTATHTATTTTKAPANAHARSAQSTPPRIPNRPPGLFRQKRNNQEMQPKQDSATQQPQPRGYPTLTPTPRANAVAPVTIPSWNISSPPPSRHCAPRPHGPHRHPPAVRPPSPGGCFPQGKTTFVLYLRCAKPATEPFTRTTSNSQGSPYKQPPPLRNAGHLLTAPVGRGGMMCMTRLTESQANRPPSPCKRKPPCPP